MRTEPSLYFNFNQMLVMSVLVHCLFMTFVLFMPKMKLNQQVVKPSFFVDLVDLSALAGVDPNPKTGETQKETTPVVPQKETKIPPVEKTPEAKIHVPPSLLDHLPEQLSQSKPGGNQNNLVEKLDQVAKLETQVTTPSKKKNNPVLLDENIKDLESLKLAPQVDTVQKKTAPRNMETTLQGFEALKMEESLEPVGEIPVFHEPQEDLTLEEMEFALLAQKEVENKGPAKKTIDPAMMKVLMELEELKKKNQASPEMTRKIETTVQETQIIQSQADANKVLEKIARLSEGGVTISFEMEETSPSQSLDFKSEVWEIETPKIETQVPGKTGTVKATKQTYMFKGTEGASQAPEDALSRFVGLVHQRIFSHWRNPLGAGHSLAQVSFYIFRDGNISQPRLARSSGDEQLDRLALLAIKDSEPFPAIPSELKEPNLHITINFKYVHKQ